MIGLRSRANLGNESSWLVTFSDLILLLFFFLLFGLSWAKQRESPSPEKASAAPARRRPSATALVQPVNFVPVLVAVWDSDQGRGVSSLEPRPVSSSREASGQGGESRAPRTALPVPVAASDGAQAWNQDLLKEQTKAGPTRPGELSASATGPLAGPGNSAPARSERAGSLGPEGEATAADPAKPDPALRDAGKVPSNTITGRDPTRGDSTPIQIALSDSETSREFFSNISYKGEQPQDLVITLLDTVGFPSSSSEIFPSAVPLLRQVRSFAARYPNMGIEVSGHTDNVPIHSVKYASNWELASARALAVAHFLMADGSVSPCRVSARGFGEYRPVASNVSPRGRARNRRVEIRFYQGENGCVEASARE